MKTLLFVGSFIDYTSFNKLNSFRHVLVRQLVTHAELSKKEFLS